MSTIMHDQEKLKHPYHQLMELTGSNLQSELDTWSREDLITWLSWNDSNGIYKDEDSLNEFDNILGKDQAIEIIIRQISEG